MNVDFVDIHIESITMATNVWACRPTKMPNRIQPGAKDAALNKDKCLG
jgi:hypothetical protein